MSVRLCCCVPFCRRTTAERYAEWICADHWRSVDKRTKRFRRLALAARQRAQDMVSTISSEGDACARVHGGVHYEILDRFRAAADARDKATARCARAWERCKREAIERAMGIS